MTEMPTYQLFIDGTWCDAEGGALFESIDPATGVSWARMPAAGEADVNRAVSAAARAFEAGPWPRMTATQRGRLLSRLADLVADRAKLLAEIETRDTGKIIRETQSQIAYAADYYRYFAGLADKIEGATLPIDKVDLEVFTKREPLGVVAAVVPWNSQQFLAAVKLGPALAMGNTVVLKASEVAPAPLFEFARLVEEAGFPAGVVNVITGFGEPCGRALTSHPKVARVAFTGGPDTAREIVRNTADNFAVTSLELGGKSPILVFADSDLESATNGVLAGNFGASGQSCVAGSRLLVERSIRDALVERLVERAAAIRIGDPLDESTEMGPLATSDQLEKIDQVVSASVAAGCRCLSGGAPPDGLKRGFYYAPTILDCPGRDFPCVEEELFGPVLSVLAFDGEDQAIELANATRFGLAAGVFTRDLARAHRVVNQLRAGIVWVNTYRAVSPIAPFGGFGQSGYGREAGFESALEYTRTKTIWINTSNAPVPDPFVMR